MPRIILTNRINAPIETCFNLARSIDLHTETMKHTGERAIAGVTSGLIELGETVTWQARHFGLMMKLTSKITEFKFPEVFSDEMIAGPFKKIAHRHLFETVQDGTIMTDVFEFESPLGILGHFIDKLFMEKYLKKLLELRNQIIKEKAEILTEIKYENRSNSTQN